jgi:hypothetical protein
MCGRYLRLLKVWTALALIGQPVAQAYRIAKVALDLDLGTLASSP